MQDKWTRAHVLSPLPLGAQAAVCPAGHVDGRPQSKAKSVRSEAHDPEMRSVKLSRADPWPRWAPPPEGLVATIPRHEGAGHRVG